MKAAKVAQKVKLALAVGSIVSFIGCAPLHEGIQGGEQQRLTIRQTLLLNRIDAFSRKLYVFYPTLKEHEVPLGVKFLPDKELNSLLKSNNPKWVLKEDNAGIMDERRGRPRYTLMLPESGNVSERTIAILVAKFSFQNSPHK